MHLVLEGLMNRENEHPVSFCFRLSNQEELPEPGRSKVTTIAAFTSPDIKFPNVSRFAVRKRLL